jgi:hypothetical protein
MSFEDAILLQVMRAVHAVRLDAIVIGNAAAALQGVPVTTQDIDLFVRETPQNDGKIKQLVEKLGNNIRATRPFEPASRMIRLEGLAVDIDLVFQLSSRAKFESVRSRSHLITVEQMEIRVCDLRDLIDAKRASGRPKDLATLPLLEQFQRIREAVERESDET